MKSSNYLFLLAFCTSVGLQAKDIVLSGSIKNVPKIPSKIFLYEYWGTETLKFDSATVQTGGNFTFKYKKPLTRGFYRLVVNNKLAVDLVLGNESLEANFDGASNSVKISNSKEFDLFSSFNTANQNYSENLNLIQQKASTLSELQGQNPPAFELEMKALKRIADSLNLELNKTHLKLATDNKGLYVAKYIAAISMNDSTTKQSYLTKNDFLDKELLHGQGITVKISLIFQRFVEANLTDYQTTANEIIQLSTPGSQSREITYQTLIRLFTEASKELTTQFVNAYKKEFPTSKRMKAFVATIPKGEISIGDDVPEIQLMDTSGTTPISLSSLKGNVILLDFWASWCGPCRMENPNVVAAYKRFKDKGFTVFSVSLDESKDRWKAAIAKDGLIWPNHVSDLKGWKSSAAKKFNVSSIPATFLIDKNGKIVAKNLRGAELENKLNELFK